MSAILNLLLPLVSYCVGTNSIKLLYLRNVQTAIEISTKSHERAEFWVLPLYDRHLWLTISAYAGSLRNCSFWVAGPHKCMQIRWDHVAILRACVCVCVCACVCVWSYKYYRCMAAILNYQLPVMSRSVCCSSIGLVGLEKWAEPLRSRG